jgi:hypothetical protein
LRQDYGQARTGHYVESLGAGKRAQYLYVRLHTCRSDGAVERLSMSSVRLTGHAKFDTSLGCLRVVFQEDP